MATLGDLIDDAYRESNVVSINSTPTDNELAEGLDRLNAIILSTVGSEAGRELTDLNIGGDYDQSECVTTYIPEDVRLVLNLTENKTFKLHPQPYDGQRVQLVDGNNTVGAFTVTLDANGRKIDGAATFDVETTDDLAQWMYRADIADWVRITSLGDGDQMPFPTEYDDYFVIALAMRLNPRHSAQIDQQSLAAFERSKQQIQARYRKPRPTQDWGSRGLLNQGNWSGSTDSFNRGRIR